MLGLARKLCSVGGLKQQIRFFLRVEQRFTIFGKVPRKYSTWNGKNACRLGILTEAPMYTFSLHFSSKNYFPALTIYKITVNIWLINLLMKKLHITEDMIYIVFVADVLFLFCDLSLKT